MGTNYYLMSEDKAHVKKTFGSCEYEIVDEPFFGYEIHICKTSAGWKPLFQKHKPFSTFRDLQEFIFKNIYSYRIFDEYGKEYDFASFKKKMIDHASAEPEPLKWVLKDEANGKQCLDLEDCKESEADIHTPLSHAEYQKSEEDAMERFGYHPPFWLGPEDMSYVEDPDYPFDWVDREFS